MSGKKTSRKGKLAASSFHVSVENAIICVVAFILGMVVAFSFGVEKGRRLIIREYQSGPVKTAVSKEPPPALAPTAPAAARAEDVLADAQPLELQKAAKQAEKQPKPPKSEPERKKTVDKTYTVQVASFQRQNRADTLVRDLMDDGYDAFIAQKGSYYIVCVGRYGRKVAALDLQERLRKTFHDCLIRSL
ncbi:MAG: SPOR domain-containing protein [Candidatus Omnitrophota bacterium]